MKSKGHTAVLPSVTWRGLAGTEAVSQPHKMTQQAQVLMDSSMHNMIFLFLEAAGSRSGRGLTACQTDGNFAGNVSVGERSL